MQELIGIGGRLSNGKDVVADYLVEKHGYTKIGFSDPLHEAMMKLNPLVCPATEDDGGDQGFWRYASATEQLGYVESKDAFPEYRRLLQVFGTEVMRDMFGKNVWVDIAAKRIKGLFMDGKKVVITGVRYSNEIDMIDDLLGESWWVERPGYPVGTTNHPSENTLDADHFERTIMNDGDLEQLYKNVDASMWRNPTPNVWGME